MFKVIDISKHNTVTDFAKVKASGVEGVIIRAGYGRVIGQKDKTFDGFYAAAKAAGLHIGAYWYSYAASAAEAEIEAAVFCKAIEGKQFDLPVFYDIEEKSQLELGQKVCSDMIDRFCGHLEDKGYYTGVYSYDAFYGNISSIVQAKYTKWVARVESIKPSRCTSYDLWQYTWKTSVNGISGDVDCSYCYKDFPTIIKNAQLNGYSKGDKYNVTARMAGLSRDKATAISEACAKMGMTVVISED